MLIYRRTYTRGSLIAYVLLSAPSVVVELVFERNSRPKYNENELRTSGDDLEAKGLTEWMWDILYWTWGCVVLTAIFGDWAWYFYVIADHTKRLKVALTDQQIAVPIYSAWLAYSTFGNVRQMFGLGGGVGQVPEGTSSATASKRQAKIEKRGGQKMQYR